MTSELFEILLIVVGSFVLWGFAMGWSLASRRATRYRQALDRITWCITCDVCRDTARHALGMSTSLKRSTPKLRKQERTRERTERTRWN
jgi:hypothetical protein